MTCAGKRGVPTLGPRASGSELGMATTLAEGLGGGSRAHGVPRAKGQAGGKGEQKKYPPEGVVERRRTDCPKSPLDQGNQCAAVCRCRDVSQQLGPGESGVTSGTVSCSTQTRNLVLGEGVQDPDWTAAPSALHDETYVLSPTILLCSSWSSSSPVCYLSPPHIC